MNHNFLNFDSLINNSVDKLPVIIPYYFANQTHNPGNVTYQDVNKDLKLRGMMTKYYLTKSKKWITKYPKFSDNRVEILEKLDHKGHTIIYKILRLYVKKKEINWYDLKEYYSFVKEFIIHNLAKM